MPSSPCVSATAKTMRPAHASPTPTERGPNLRRLGRPGPAARSHHRPTVARAARLEPLRGRCPGRRAACVRAGHRPAVLPRHCPEWPAPPSALRMRIRGRGRARPVGGRCARRLPRRPTRALRATRARAHGGPARRARRDAPRPRGRRSPVGTRPREARPHRAPPVARAVPVLLECAVGELNVALGRLDVDPHVRREREPQLTATFDAVRAQQTPHARQQRAQADVVRGRRIVPPQGLRQRPAAYRMPVAIDQAGEDNPGLTTGKTIFQAVASPLDGQAATQADPEARSRPGGRNHHGGAIVLPCNTNV